MSLGPIIGGIVAAGIAFLIPGGAAYAGIAFAAGAMAGSIADPMTARGQRIDEARVGRSALGSPIPLLYFSNRVAGNLTDYTDLREVSKKQKVGIGTKQETLEYYQTLFFTLGETLPGDPPFFDVVRIWADKELVYDKRPPSSTGDILQPEDGEAAASFFVVQDLEFGVTVFSGAEDQLPDAEMEAQWGVGQVSAYRGQYGIKLSDFPLHKFGNRIPVLEFETITSSTGLSSLKTMDPAWSRPLSPPVEDLTALDYSAGVAMFSDPSSDRIYYRMAAYAHPNGQEAGDPAGMAIVAVSKWTGALIAAGRSKYLPRLEDMGEGMYGADGASGESYGAPLFRPPGAAFLFTAHTMVGSDYSTVWLCKLDEASFACIQRSPTPAEAGAPTSTYGQCLQLVATAAGNCVYAKLGEKGPVLNFAVWNVFDNTILWGDWADYGYSFASNPTSACFDAAGRLWVGCRDGKLAVYDVGTTGAPTLTLWGEWYPASPDDLMDGVVGSDFSRAIMALTYVPSTEEFLCWYYDLRSTVGHGSYDEHVFVRFDIGSRTGSAMMPYTPASAPPPSETNNYYSWNDRSGTTQDNPWFAQGNPVRAVLGFNLLNAETGAEKWYPMIEHWGAESADPAKRAGNVMLCAYDPSIHGIWAARWADPSAASQPDSDPSNDWTPSTAPIGNQGLGVYFLDRAGAQGGALSYILDDLAARGGNASADRDFSAQDQTVLGFQVNSRQPARSVIEMLTPAYFFDIVESDWKLLGVNRGGTVTQVIPDRLLGAAGPGGDHTDRLTVERTADRELPASIDFSYIDQARDYATGNQPYVRPATVQRSEQAIQIALPVVMTADAAFRAARAIIGEAWAARETFKGSTWLNALGMDPTDVIAFERRGREIEAKVTRATLGANWVIDVEAVGHDRWVYQVLAGDGDEDGPTSDIPSGGGGYVPGTVKPTSPATVLVLDTGLLRQQDDSPGLYVTAAPSVAGGLWSGAVIEASSDGVTYEAVAETSGTPPAGTAMDALADNPRWTTWDRTSTVQVRLTGGVLVNETEARLIAGNGVNLMLLGDELIQFATATQLSPGVWELSTLLRGLLGTDWAVGGHVAGERAVLIDPEWVRSVDLVASEIDAARFYRAQSGSRLTPAGAPVVQTSRRLMPWAPYAIKGTRAGDDLTGTFIRRSRAPGPAQWMSPLFETAAVFEVDVMDGAVVMRTITATASPNGSAVDAAGFSFLYDAADQTADFGSPQAAVTVRIYQLNALRGRGFPGVATL